MKLSTKGRYGSRAMLELALHYGEGPVSVKEIAERQDISVRYLENLMISLLSRGLVTSVRGKGGGFTLARAPEEIRLLEVIRATEGSLSPVACVDEPEACKRSGSCVTIEIWELVKQSLTDVLGSITLRDMVHKYAQKTEREEALMYYI
jgi:Rrf2 family cysteine metabolism transcriptional repressor